MILKSVQSFGFFRRRYANGQTEKSEQVVNVEMKKDFKEG